MTMNAHDEQRYKRRMKQFSHDEFMVEIKSVKKMMKDLSQGTENEMQRSREMQELMDKWTVIMTFLKELISVPTDNSDRPNWERLRDERQRRQVQRRHDLQMEQRRTNARRDDMV